MPTYLGELEKAARARAEVSRAFKDGRLVRLPCETCGKEPTHAHHDDYGKPLAVRFLCYRHHAAVGPSARALRLSNLEADLPNGEFMGQPAHYIRSAAFVVAAAGVANKVRNTLVPVVVTRYGTPQYAIVPIPDDRVKIERGRRQAKKTGVLR